MFQNTKKSRNLAKWLLCLVLFSVGGCQTSTTPKDLQPIINGQFKNAKKVFYPSTDSKVSAIIIDENGDVYYLRMNGAGDMRDNVRLFNVSDK